MSPERQKIIVDLSNMIAANAVEIRRWQVVSHELLMRSTEPGESKETFDRSQNLHGKAEGMRHANHVLQNYLDKLKHEHT